MPLSAEQKRLIIEQRLAQFETDLFVAELNKAVAVAANDVALIAAHDEAISVAQTNISVHEQELATLPHEPSA